MSKQSKQGRGGDLVKVTGLWEEIDRNGHTYYSGKVNAVCRVLIMPNTFKKTEAEPDYWLYYAPNREPQGRDRDGYNDNEPTQGRLNFR